MCNLYKPLGIDMEIPHFPFFSKLEGSNFNIKLYIMRRTRRKGNCQISKAAAGPGGIRNLQLQSVRADPVMAFSNSNSNRLHC